MSLEVRRISCLSLGKEDEDLYPRKAMIGDLIRLYLYNGMKPVGYLTKIGKNGNIVISLNDKDYTVNLEDIKSFVVITRGTNSRNYFVF